MKRLFSVFTLLAAALLLASCGSRDPLSKRVNEVADLGAMPLPGSDFQLHGYRVMNAGMARDHFVYLVERNGQPVAGSAVNMEVSSGKSTTNLGITSVVLDTPAGEEGAPSIQVKCANEAQCTRIVAAISSVR